MKNDLLSNIDLIHTTVLGEERIKRNLALTCADVVAWCKARTLDEHANITRKGKNWYVLIDHVIITINAHSYTIITAHQEKSKKRIMIEKRNIGHIPALLYGETSNQIYLYIHGQGGHKEEAMLLSEVICAKGWQVLSIDLPQHGERTQESNMFDPWHCSLELQEVRTYVNAHWNKVALYANSIGAYFSLQAYANASFVNALFVSPLIDMERMITNMMKWANVSETKLEQTKTIEITFGQTLSWEYLQYVRQHPIGNWQTPTSILYAERDTMVERDTIDAFKDTYGCDVTIMKDGEHYFHTPQQLQVLKTWIEKHYDREQK